MNGAKGTGFFHRAISATVDLRWRCRNRRILEFDDLSFADLNFDDQYADFARPKIFNRVRRKRRHPLCAGNRRRFSRLAAIKENPAALVAPDEVTPALHIGKTTPTVGVQGDHIACRDGGLKHAHAVIFEKERVVLWGGDERVK